MGQVFPYVIIGSGLAGASAVQGIREQDKTGAILLLGNEKELPYDRPPLTKQLWLGKKKVGEIFLHDRSFYSTYGVELGLGEEVSEISPKEKVVKTTSGKTFSYQKLLLATGGRPRRLSIPGGEIGGICYYRYFEDYVRIRKEASPGKSAVVIGGGFIGSEIAASLNVNKVEVTMIFPEEHLVNRVFPKDLGEFLTDHYRSRGVRILSGDVPVSIERKGKKYVTQTRGGLRLESDIILVGIGIIPSTELAQTAGLSVENGISVNRYLQTSDPSIFAAGDNAFFPYLALGRSMRVEHWDNALNQGKCAGKNMVQVNEPYAYMPYFFSDLFEFGYEAVGEVDARLETSAKWEKENDTGVIYYLKDGRVRGAMMCNVWGKVEAARELIRKGEIIPKEKLKTAI